MIIEHSPLITDHWVTDTLEPALTARDAVVREYSPGELLCRQGAQADRAFLLKAGSLRSVVVPDKVLVEADEAKKSVVGTTLLTPPPHEPGVLPRWLHEQGATMLLTVDCGISDMEPVARARELGMVVVVSDHHLPAETLPDAHAVCDPRLCRATPVRATRRL